MVGARDVFRGSGPLNSVSWKNSITSGVIVNTTFHAQTHLRPPEKPLDPSQNQILDTCLVGAIHKWRLVVGPFSEPPSVSSGHLPDRRRVRYRGVAPPKACPPNLASGWHFSKPDVGSLVGRASPTKCQCRAYVFWLAGGYTEQYQCS